MKKVFFALAALLCVATVSLAQPLPPQPGGKLPLPPNIEKIKAPAKKALKYNEGIGVARDTGKQLFVFIGVPSGPREGYIVCEGTRKEFPDYPAKCVVLGEYVDGSFNWKATYAATGERIEPQEGVSRLALPFLNKLRDNRAKRIADDNGPWLSREESDKIKDMWPEGVPLPPTLKFYKLRPASQAVAAFDVPGTGKNRRFLPVNMRGTNANREFPWIGSGGMDHAQKGTWRNVTGMALPEDGKIKVWLAPMLVSNQPEIAMHWKFPADIKMFDVLLRKNDDGSEHIFTVRLREKKSGTWDDGTSYVPDVPIGEISSYTHEGNHRTKNVLGVGLIKYRVAEIMPLPIKKYRFREDKTAIADSGHFFPPGYVGAGLSCNKCHNGGAHEAKDYGGALLRGKDTVFSWYPVPESLVVDGESLETSLFRAVHDPVVDDRWPIEFGE